MKEDQTILNNFLPGLFKSNFVKQALLLQLIFPEPFHILLLGDSDTGKTTILKEIAQLEKKAKYYSRINDGLKELKLLCLDDLELASEKEQLTLIDLMASGTSVLAAAGPKYGVFDCYNNVAIKTSLLSKLLNNFDLFFLLRDLSNEEKDLEKVHEFLNPKESDAFILPKTIPTEVVVSEGIKQLVEDFYVTWRKVGLPVGFHQVTTILKLIKASALLQQRKEAKKEDFEQATQIMDHCFHSVLKGQKVKR